MNYFIKIKFPINKIITVLVLFSVSIINSYTQNSNLLFRHLTTNNGLSSNSIEAIFQDSYGFIWIATDFGLNKYDGHEFTQYKASTDNIGDLDDNSITEVFEDSYGLFWVGTANSGLYLFDREQELFYHLDKLDNSSNGLVNTDIRSIFEDSKHNLWIGTSGGGLQLFNRADSSFISFVNNPDKINSLGSNYIGSISEDLSGNLWIGSTAGILCEFKYDKLEFTNYKLHNSIRSHIFSSINGYTLIDSDNNVWFGTGAGLFILNQNNNSITHLQKGNSKYNLNSNTVTSILEYKKDIFFIATDHGGINIYNKATGEISYHKAVKYDNTTISNNQVQTIYKAPDGVIWIGSFSGGLDILRSTDKFQHYKDLLQNHDKLECCNSALSMCEDLDGNIWIGYDGQGIDIWNPNTLELKHITTGLNNSIRSDIITSLYSDANGNIWIGYYLDGMSVFDWNTKTFTYISHGSNEDTDSYLNNVWGVLQDSDDEYWIGTHFAGLKLFNKRTNTYAVYNKGVSSKSGIRNEISDNYITKIYKDLRGNIWVGTIEGLNRFDRENKGFVKYKVSSDDSNSIKGVWIHDIYQDKAGNLWIATNEALNLYRYGTNDFLYFSESNGINGEEIKLILEDDNNNLWLSTNKGVSRFNYKERVVRNFDIADDLQDKELNHNSGLRSIDGKLYFGGQNSFIVFDPQKIRIDTSVPPIFITDFKISDMSVSHNDKNSVLNKHISFTNDIELSYLQSELSFTFTALNFINSNKNQYKYILEGFDSEWKESGVKREVNYTNLSPGTYMFRVKASNRDGVWNDTEKTLSIIIIPPFWKTGWFIFLETIVLILFILFIVYLRERTHQKATVVLSEKVKERTEEVNLKNEELILHRSNLEDKVKERTSELKAAKLKAEESDRLKSAFLANMSHEIRTPLNGIIGFSSFLADSDITDEEREEYLSIIHNNSDSLIMLIDDILDFSTIEANQLVLKNKSFHVNKLLDNLYSNFLLSNKKSQVKILFNNKLVNEQLLVKSDRLRVKQILTNLMQNAIKFTNIGFVELGLYKDGNRLIFYIKDSGVGISKANQVTIFQRFRKSEGQANEQIRGIGLGLSISKRLAELLDGTLTVESELGKGSIFSFAMPISKTEVPHELNVSEAKNATSKSLNKKLILIVEDEPSNYLLLKKALEKSKSKTMWAKNGLEAIDMFEKDGPFSLILMDIKMPEMGGYDALKIIKEKNPNQIVIAQTAYARPEDKIKLNSAGFDDYLSKPIRISNLYSILDLYL